MPLLTYAQAKDSTLADVAGTCSNSDLFRSYLNKSVRMLMNRGNFWGTVQKIRVCVYNNCITWPRYVATPLAVNIANHWTPVYNNWWGFMPLNYRSDFGHGGFGFSNGCCTGNLAVENDGVTPVFNQVKCGQANYIRVYPSVQADIGKTTTIFGVDSNGQTIRTKVNSTTWQDGVTLTLALPFVSTPMQVQEVTRIHKEVTQGVVRYYQYDSNNDVLLDLVSYDPYETDPMYRHSKIANFRSLQSCSQRPCNGLVQIDALVKLEFVEVKTDSDLVLIENLDALEDAIQGIKKKQQGDTEGGLLLMNSAVHELNLELRNRFPLDQTPVEVLSFGTSLPARHGIGMI